MVLAVVDEFGSFLTNSLDVVEAGQGHIAVQVGSLCWNSMAITPIIAFCAALLAT